MAPMIIATYQGLSLITYMVEKHHTQDYCIHYYMCARVQKYRFRGAKSAIGRDVPTVPCDPGSRSPARFPARGGWGAGPSPSLRLSAATVTRRRSHSSRRPAAAEPRAALVDRTALRAATAAGCRVFGRGLGAGDHWQRLRGLGQEDRVVGDRHRSAEGSVGSAIRGVRERVC